MSHLSLIIFKILFLSCLWTVWLWSVKVWISLTLPYFLLLNFLGLQINFIHQNWDISSHYFFMPLSLFFSLLRFSLYICGYDGDLVAKSCLTLVSMDKELARLLCPWDFPGKNTGVGCHFFSRESSRPRDQPHISCIAGGFFTTEPPGKPLYVLSFIACHKSLTFCLFFFILLSLLFLKH